MSIQLSPVCNGIVSEAKTPILSRVKEVELPITNALANNIKGLKSDVVSFSGTSNQGYKVTVNRPDFKQKEKERIHPYSGLPTVCTKVSYETKDGKKVVGFYEDVPNRIQVNHVTQKTLNDGRVIIEGQCIDPKTGMKRKIYGINQYGENAYKDIKALSMGGDFIYDSNGKLMFDLTKLPAEERARVIKTLPKSLFEVTEKGVDSM